MYVARMAVFGLDTIPQMFSCCHVVDGCDHCHQQANNYSRDNWVWGYSGQVTFLCFGYIFAGRFFLNGMLLYFSWPAFFKYWFHLQLYISFRNSPSLHVLLLSHTCPSHLYSCLFVCECVQCSGDGPKSLLAANELKIGIIPTFYIIIVLVVKGTKQYLDTIPVAWCETWHTSLLTCVVSTAPSRSKVF